MKYPNRAQRTEVARRNGKKGKSKSPWNRGPMVKSKANEQRQKEWDSE